MAGSSSRTYSCTNTHTQMHTRPCAHTPMRTHNRGTHQRPKTLSIFLSCLRLFSISATLLLLIVPRPLYYLFPSPPALAFFFCSHHQPLHLLQYVCDWRTHGITEPISSLFIDFRVSLLLSLPSPPLLPPSLLSSLPSLPATSSFVPLFFFWTFLFGF